MPAERIAMRHVRDVLRLKTAGVSGNEIARRLNVAPSTVRLTLQRLAAAGLHWPLPAEMTDTALEAQLFSAVGKKRGHRRCPEPDWAMLHRELKRKHVTLQILWGEPFAPIAGATSEGMQSPVMAIAILLIFVGLFAFVAVLLRFT